MRPFQGRLPGEEVSELDFEGLVAIKVKVEVEDTW